jgi:hypothetical protein
VAKSAPEYEPLQPGPLSLRDSVRKSLYSLRHFTHVSFESLSPPREVAPAILNLALVEQVERALKCQLPFEILACLANHDDELLDQGFSLGQVADHTRKARKRGCPKDLIAVGCQPDSHAYYCVSRDGPRNRAVQLADRDNFDGAVNWYDLGDWLSDLAEGRRLFLAEQYDSLADWKPAKDQYLQFAPLLVAAGE